MCDGPAFAAGRCRDRLLCGWFIHIGKELFGMADTYNQFFHDLAVRESVGIFDKNATPNYQALGDNGLNYLGAYQFEGWALINLGYYKDDGNPNANQWKDGYWTGKDGINSKQDFLNNPAVQDSAARQWMQNFVWGWVQDLGLDKYIGQTIGGVDITASGLLAGAHLRGASAVQQFIASGGQKDATDPYGTPVSQYMSRFSNYQTPFDSGSSPKTVPSDDLIVLHVSADSWNGSPQFIVGVDGKQQGGTQTATASHAKGQTQDIVLSGAFGNGAHDVTVTFLNDAWGGTSSTDRNLYVNSIDDNGQHYASAAATLVTNGTVHFQTGTPNVNGS